MIHLSQEYLLIIKFLREIQLLYVFILLIKI